MKEFSVDVAQYEQTMEIYSSRGDIEQAFNDVNAELAKRGFDLEFVSISPGSSSYFIIPTTAKERILLAANSDIVRPDWDDIGGTRDWKIKVPQEIRDIWATFAVEQQVALQRSFREQIENQ